MSTQPFCPTGLSFCVFSRSSPMLALIGAMAWPGPGLAVT